MGRILACEQEGNLYTAEVEVEGYEKLNSWKRKLTMDASECTWIVEDVIDAKEAVEIDWLLHSLSQPVEDDEKVIIQRNGIRLEISVQEGLLSEVLISDTYDVDLNAGLPPEHHVTMPQQYHMQWKTKRDNKHLIKVKMKVVSE